LAGIVDIGLNIAGKIRSLVFGLFDLLIQSAKFLVQRIQIFFIRAQRNLILDSHPAQFQRLD
jgi:hypothetical protein